jgi:diguanylate cyclase (GGDEF)-like protein
MYTPLLTDNADLQHLNDQAVTLRFRAPAEALPLAQQAEVIARALREAAALRRSLVTQGSCLVAMGVELSRAFEIMDEALKHCIAGGDDPLRGELLVEMGLLRLLLHDTPQAIARLHEAIALNQSLGAKEWVVRARRHLGNAHINDGNYDEALATLLDALDVAERLGFDHLDRFFHTIHHAERAELFRLIAVTYSNLGEYEQSLAYYQIALEHFRQYQPAMAGRTLYNMGIAYEEMTQLDLAFDYYQQALALHYEQGNAREAGISLIGIGNTYTQKGDFDQAQATLEEASRLLSQDKGALPYYSDAVWFLGRLFLSQERYLEALSYLRTTYDLFIDIGRAKDDFSRVYKALRDFETALYHHEQYHELLSEYMTGLADKRLRALMVQFDTERALKEREIYQLRNVELEREIAERREAEATLARTKAELERKNRKLQHLSTRDPLTNLYNRRYLEVRLADTFATALQHAEPLSVLLCDIDHFKQINDHYSHAIGDEALRGVATLMRDAVRQSDIVARYGGEEFVVVLPGATHVAALATAEKLRARVEAHFWEAIHPALHVTLSIGVATRTTHLDHEKLLHDADTMLYRAKAQGRNRVAG